MDISLSKLQQLVTVAGTGSFSRAAVELNISQPALSRSIAGIEGRYGFQIFKRMGYGVQLTAAGAQVIEQAQVLLQNMRVFDNNLRLFGSGRAGTLAIGLAPLLASQLLSGFASEFFHVPSQASLRVLIRSGATLIEGLKDDSIELFFYPEGYIEAEPDIETEPVGHIFPVCVVRNGHPLAERNGLTLADLSAYPWASSVALPIIEQTLKSPQFICDNYHILRDTVQDSDLICIATSIFVAEQLAEGKLREIQVQGLPLPVVPIYMAKLRGRVSSPLAEVAIQRIRNRLA